MPERWTDPTEREASRPASSPVSAFLWTGLAFLGGAAALGIATMLFSVNESETVSRRGMLYAIGVLLIGVMFLFAQARYLFWRRAAGIPDPHPLAPPPYTPPTPSERLLRKWDILILVNLAALAALPRLVALFHSLWYDELWTVHFMQYGPAYAVTHQESYNNHLFNSLLGSLCLSLYEAFNGELVKTALPPVWLVRLPAFLFGVASVPLLYLVGREHIGRAPAGAAAVLLALSPVAIDFSAQARGYSALLFFTIAQTYFLLTALRSTSPVAWICWVFCAILGTFSHLYFVFVILADGLFLMARALWHAVWLQDRPRALALMEQLIVMGMAWAFGVVLCYAAVYSALQSAMQDTGPPMARASEVLLPLLQLWNGVPQGVFLTTSYIAAAGMILLGLYYLYNRPAGAILYLPLLLIVGPFVVEAVRPHFVYMRFFLYALPAWLTLIACGMWQLSLLVIGYSPARGKWRFATLYLLVAVWTLLGAPGLWQTLRLPKQDFQQAALRMRQEIGPGDVGIGLGLGCEYFGFYGLKLKLPRQEAELRDLAKGAKSLVIVDTDLLTNPNVRPPLLPQVVRAIAPRPIATFPGRYADWSARWLDGDADIKIYRVSAQRFLSAR